MPLNWTSWLAYIPVWNLFNRVIFRHLHVDQSPAGCSQVVVFCPTSGYSGDSRDWKQQRKMATRTCRSAMRSSDAVCCLASGGLLPFSSRKNQACMVRSGHGKIRSYPDHIRTSSLCSGIVISYFLYEAGYVVLWFVSKMIQTLMRFWKLTGV